MTAFFAAHSKKMSAVPEMTAMFLTRCSYRLGQVADAIAILTFGIWACSWEI
jgi:hypothetical protein